MHYVSLAAVVLMFCAFAQAALQTQSVEYQQGETTFRGHLVYDDAVQGQRPAVIVVPEWWGLNDYAKRRASQLAEMGYVDFAADMYGEGKITTDPKQAGAWAGEVKGNRELMRQRINAAVDVVKKNEMVDPQSVAAIGYCFGGTTVLELARSGADVAGVASFHGGLDSPDPQAGKNIKAKVLILHGAEDPFIKPQDMAAFQEEMRKGNVDWQMNFYSGAVHSFTNPDAGKTGMDGVAYNEKADRRSWEALKVFLSEIFGR